MSAQQAGAARQLNAMGGQKDKLGDDIKTVVGEAEELLQQARSSTAETYSAVRGELEDKLAHSIAKLQEVQKELRWRARQAAKAADGYVHENPWKSMGYVALAAVVAGVLLARGR